MLQCSGQSDRKALSCGARVSGGGCRVLFRETVTPVTIPVSQKMKSVVLSHGRIENLVLLGGGAMALSAFILVALGDPPNFLRHCESMLPYTISTIWVFGAYWRHCRGKFELRWDDQHAQILNRDTIIFDGKFAEMAMIDRDLREYYLYPLDYNDVYRLKRGLVDDTLQVILNAAKEANKAALPSGNGSTSTNH